ncbi:syndecan-1-like isoform X2 [Sardina pilchardus]|uniref:syndecan-1-like isoform X2 n=1 Tax=Sardina pilchardus TaxID=27697 RepID=UPI002E148519
MKASWLAAWLLFTGICMHPGHTSSPPEDLDGSGDDAEGSGSGDLESSGSGPLVKTTTLSQMTLEGGLIREIFVGDTKREGPPVTAASMPRPTGQGSHGFLEDKETLAAVVSGGVGALALALVLVGAVVYFMKRREKGKYAAAQHTNGKAMYHQAPTKDEFITA